MIVLPTSKLTVKQEAFCMHYAKTGNATESYIAAGYKANNNDIARVNAAKLLTKHNIQEKLQEIAQEIKSSKIADVTEIQEYLTSVMRREKRDQEEKKRREGRTDRYGGCMGLSENISDHILCCICNEQTGVYQCRDSVGIYAEYDYDDITL